MDLAVNPMRDRGIFFILIILYLILSLVLLRSVVESNDRSRDTFPEKNALARAQNRFNNIYRSVIDLDKTGANKNFDQRLIPLSFEFDQNAIDINQYLPVKEGSLETYLDALSIYALFVNDTNYANLYDGVQTTLQTPKTADWGGTQTGIGFLIAPTCLAYRLVDDNTTFVHPKNTPACRTDAYDLNRSTWDINLIADSASEDWNRITCTPGPCPQNAHNPLDNRPYFRIQTHTTICPACNIVPSTVSGHFDLNSNQQIVIDNSAPGASSKPITITILDGLRIQHTDTKSLFLQSRFTVSKRIEDFSVDDLNLRVQITDHNIQLSNQPLP